MLKNMPPFWRHRLKSYVLSLLATIGFMLLLIGIGSIVLTREPLIATWERQNLPLLQYIFISIAALGAIWYS